MLPLLETRSLCRYFGGLKALEKVDIQVFDGEIFGIIGPNGAGKTTLFNVITGFLEATSGSVLFKGKQITNLAPERIARLGIARTFQNIRLFKHMTVLENVRVGFHIHTKTSILDAFLRSRTFWDDETKTMQRSLDIFRRVGLVEQMFYTASSLPYGMQRKLEIARALASDPVLLLLDEPAAGMNPKETADLVEFIRKLNKEGLTIMIIEHDMKVIMNVCHRIAVLNYGVKICEGTPTDVQCNQEVIEAYLGRGRVSFGKSQEGPLEFLPL
jgi:branched-chain amino acid transport system ATP-binding protein